MVKLKRAYEPVSRTDGMRILVERLWPRGLSKHKLKLDGWMRDVGPTTELRKWFGHRTVTLVYSSRDDEHNNAVALSSYLQVKVRRRRASG